MKLLKLNTLLLLLFPLWMQCALAVDIPPPQYTMTVSSPIYRSQTENISLDVTIPKHYKPIQTAAQAAALHLLQFIPQNSTAKDWQEMIVLQIVVNKSLDAAQFTEIIAQKVQDKLKNMKVLTKNIKTENKYLVSTLAIYYETGSRREISYMNYYSSPGHLCGIQLIRALKPDEKPETVLEDMIGTVDKISVIKTRPNQEKSTLNVRFDTAK